MRLISFQLRNYLNRNRGALFSKGVDREIRIFPYVYIEYSERSSVVEIQNSRNTAFVLNYTNSKKEKPVEREEEEEEEGEEEQPIDFIYNIQ